MTAIYCGDYTALAMTKWGAKIYVDTRDTSLAPHIMLQGDWEPWVTNAMVTVLQKNPEVTFIDVGANVGWYTLLACRLGANQVFAFEPNPRMCELLRKTIAVNGYRELVTLTEAACGAKDTVMALEVNPEEAGGAHLDLTAEWQPFSKSLLARIVRLDDVVFTPEAAALKRPLIMKVDVEGFEPQVLLGAKRLLESNPIMFLEHNLALAHETMYRSLLAAGFELRHAENTGFWGPPMTVDETMALGNAETVICALSGALPVLGDR